MRLIEREIHPRIREWLDRPEIIVITGSRQVGKTTLLKMVLDELDTDNKIYLDLEDLQTLSILEAGVEQFLGYLELQGFSRDRRLYVGIDEIQYLTNPSNFLKLVHDHYPQIKLIVSGSSTLQIKQKFTDSLVGRKMVFELSSFSFAEFLRLRDEQLYQMKQRVGNILSLLDGEFNPHISTLTSRFLPLLSEYLVFGGYPRAIQENAGEMKEMLLREIYTGYVRKDIKDLARIEDIMGFNHLLKLLASQIGSQVNYTELGNTLGLRLPAVKKYLFLLENTFIISLCHPFFRNKRKEVSKMPKVFFQDIGLRNATLGNFQEPERRTDVGELMENFIFTELKRRFPVNERLFYWKTLAKAEVDFVIQTDSAGWVPVEVKSRLFTSPRISRSFRSFIDQYHPRMGIVINPGYAGTTTANECTVYFLPAFGI